MSRILITGVTGLVGQNLVTSLAAAKHELFGTGRRTLPTHLPVSPLLIDLSTAWDASLLPPRIDVVVHLAQSDSWQSPDGALDVFAVNLASTAKLLDYAARAGASHFVVLSTGGLYGARDEAVSESSPLCVGDGPLRYYFETKRSAENFAGCYGDRMTVSILRPFFIYGSGQRLPKLIPRLIDVIRRGEAVRIRGEAGAILNPVHVDDVVKVIEACVLKRHAGIVNVAGGQVTSVRDISLRISQLLGVAPNFQHEPGVAERFVAEITLLTALVGAAPRRFDDGIQSVIGRTQAP